LRVTAWATRFSLLRVNRVSCVKRLEPVKVALNKVPQQLMVLTVTMVLLKVLCNAVTKCLYLQCLWCKSVRGHICRWKRICCSTSSEFLIRNEAYFLLGVGASIDPRTFRIPGIHQAE